MGLRIRGGVESLYGMAWFGSVWGGILVRIARVGSLFGSFPLVTDIPYPTERECFPGPPLIIRTVDQ